MMYLRALFSHMENHCQLSGLCTFIYGQRFTKSSALFCSSIFIFRVRVRASLSLRWQKLSTTSCADRREHFCLFGIWPRLYMKRPGTKYSPLLCNSDPASVKHDTWPISLLNRETLPDASVACESGWTWMFYWPCALMGQRWNFPAACSWMDHKHLHSCSTGTQYLHCSHLYENISRCVRKTKSFGGMEYNSLFTSYLTKKNIKSKK